MKTHRVDVHPYTLPPSLGFSVGGNVPAPRGLRAGDGEVQTASRRQKGRASMVSELKVGMKLHQPRKKVDFENVSLF